MIQDFGVVQGRTEAGYYAWVLVSGIYFGRLFSSPLMGYIIDAKGCKRPLIFVLVMLAVLSLWFGFSTDITNAAVARMCIGIF